MLTVQEISDRFQITDLLTDYCSAIDDKDLEALDIIFTKDAHIDYTKAGGPSGNLDVIKQFLKDNLSDLPRQHMISNFRIRLYGDSAHVRCMCHNPFELPNGLEIMLLGLWYNDRCIRTENGWRIKEKIIEPCFHWKIQPVVSNPLLL